jgi:hypothetical protein
MLPDTFSRTAPVANGFKVRFSFTLDCGLLCEFLPSEPHLRSWAERRRFLKHYARARQDFLAEVEAETGASLGTLDVCGEPAWQTSAAERAARTKADRRSPSTDKTSRRASV